MNTKAAGINYRVLGLIITVVVLAAGVVGTYATNTAKQTGMSEDLVELKTDGCDKSDQNREDILVMQTDITYIKGGIKTLLEKEK